MIVPMKPSHVPQIAALEKLCFSDPWSETSVAAECENPLSLWIVAEIDGRVAGYIAEAPQCVPIHQDAVAFHLRQNEAEGQLHVKIELVTALVA